MLLFSPNKVIARSRFWYYLRKLRKIKKANGEIIQVHELFEKNPNTVKNFGLWIRYTSRSDTQNMYREYRACTLCEAIDKMYNDMASRHSARQSSIQIIKTTRLKAKDCKKPWITQFHKENIKLQFLHRCPRRNPKFRRTFAPQKPVVYY
jgi:large subunit ribosomal protein L18Ae